MRTLKATRSRALATEILLEVLARRRSLRAGSLEPLGRLPDPRDRALVREICYGVLRWLPRLEAILHHLLKHPLRKRDLDVRAILLIGLYQLMFTRTPAHAAVSESVSIARERGKPWACGLVNAALRAYLRRAPEIRLALEDDLQARYAHPDWLIRTLRDAWPEHWAAVLVANNERAPMTLRVNARALDRDAYLRRLTESEVSAHHTPYTTQGLTLSHALEIERLPGFEQGLVSVQDGASQLAAELLDLRPGQHVLDACAAPGGKSAHILESTDAEVELVAVEKDPDRHRQLEQTMVRLGLRAAVICGDAACPETWWDRRLFDRILLDAPCSATGVIRRHPDIKHLRRREDIAHLTHRQGALLAALWPLLAPGGLLLYATCSVLPAENQHQIERFMGKTRDAAEHGIHAAWGMELSCGRQILPGEAAMDGFYYALLQKR